MNGATTVVHVVLAVAGFIAGFLLGRVERMTATGKTTRRRWQDIARTAFGLLVVAVVVVSYVRDSQRVSCQSAWFEAATESLRLRSAEASRSAVDQITLLETTLAGNPARSRQATQDYVDALKQVESVRASSPIPEPPEC